MRDELLRRAAAASGVLKLPAMREDAKLLGGEADALFFKVVGDDGMILLLVGREEGDDETEAVGKGDGLVHAVLSVELVLCLVAVAPALLDEMAAIGGRADEHVLGTGFDASLDGGFQILVFRFELFEGKVVEEEDEALGGEFSQRGKDARQFAELRLRELHESKALAVVFTGESLDRGGLARAARTDQKNVVGGTAGEEGFRVVGQLLLLTVIADDVGEGKRLEVLDALEAMLLLVP